MKTLAAFILSLACALSAHAGVSFYWMTHVLVPGESVQVYLVQPGDNKFTLEKAPVAQNGSIQLEQQGFMAWENTPSGRAFAMVFTCTPDKEGFLEIQPFKVTDGSGQTFTTEAQRIPVKPFDSITWLPLPQNGSSNADADSYGVMWYSPTESPYVNQSINCELKIYAPDSLSNFSIPHLNNKGIGMSRFLPYFLRQSVNPSGRALLKGKEWNSYCYGGTITPLMPGNVSVGPGTLDATTIQSQVDPIWGQYTRQLVSISLSLPEYTIKSQPLPGGAPLGYQNAVGQFTIETATEATDIVEGEPVSVNIRIAGSGNLNIIACPRPENEDDWKLYPATKLTTDTDKTGYLEYQILMKPLKEVNAIPAFHLVYFDPVQKKYLTASSQAIPLKWKAMSQNVAGAAVARLAPPPPAGAVPVEEMSDIISGYSNDTWDLAKTRLSTIIARDRVLWPYALLPAFCLVLYGFYTRAKTRQEETADQRTRLSKLNDIARKTEGKDFLRALGAYVELVLPEEKQVPEIKNILKKRDESTYLPESQKVPLSQDERHTMLNAVRKAVKSLGIFLILGLMGLSLPYADAQTETLPVLPAPQKQAVDTPQPKTASVSPQANPEKDKILDQIKNATDKVRLAQLYLLLGNQEYRQDQPGAAALAYRRALVLAPDLYEARRNLEFIERKEGAIHQDLTPTQVTLEKVSYFYFQYSFLIFFGILAATVAYMWAFRKYKTSQWFMFGIFLCATAANIWVLKTYPLTASSIAPEKQFIITQKDASAWHDATRSSQKVFTKLPPGSIARLLASRGSWNYVEFANGVRGWVPVDEGEFLARAGVNGLQ